MDKGKAYLKSLLGHSENAVQIHLCSAIWFYLLLAWVKVELKISQIFTEVSKVIEATILSNNDIRELLDVSELLTQNQNVKEFFLF